MKAMLLQLLLLLLLLLLTSPSKVQSRVVRYSMFGRGANRRDLLTFYVAVLCEGLFLHCHGYDWFEIDSYVRSL